MIGSEQDFQTNLVLDQTPNPDPQLPFQLCNRTHDVVMKFPVTSMTVLCVLLDLSDSIATDQELEERFKGRSDAEWENVWHNERHTRCRANLLKHLYWACEKDIYRLSRRNDQHNHVGSPFVSVVEARVFLRSRRDRKRRSAAGGSITDECCQAKGGCTWEEYAEYCPANKRLRKFL
uniref:Insulin-like peptide 7 n=1 Tax=Timema tahoe TaxID=61484 RepID=A0A7R9NXI9_9NEOP|nr:unnamed protein product [Timema tahoe]